MRDIEDYSQKYLVPGFENYKVYYRRKKILEIIDKYRPKHILEIGCGCQPLFQYVKNIPFTIVEPSLEFYNNAVSMAQKCQGSHVAFFKGFFEDVASELKENYDMIICSSLLHEVESPEQLLEAIRSVCSDNTIIHINVPNANSLHRLLGKEIGILRDVQDMTQNNIDFQQHRVFDMESLVATLSKNGLKVIEQGSFFIKPFLLFFCIL